MAARIAWLLNLGAERELEEPRRHVVPGSSAEVSRFRAHMQLLLRPDDRVIDVDPDLAGCSETLAFCPTPSALARIRALGRVPPPAPAVEVLARVNARSFCAALGQTLPDAAYVRDMPALLRVIARDVPDGFLLKRDFSFAGRERRRVLHGVLDRSTEGFAQRSFARGQGLQVEPWLARTHDFAQHGYVCESGAVLVGAPMLQQCDARGVWQRSETLPDGALAAHERAQLADSLMRAGNALAAAGYFGPYGIDAFRYVGRDGAARFQPLCEVNARFSMGYPRALLERALGVADSRATHPG